MRDVEVVTLALNPAVDHTVWVPGFRVGEVNRAGRERFDAGGKAVNVATFLADFSCAVAVTGFLGAENADIFRAHFARKGIVDRCVIIPGRTRTGIKIVDDAADVTTDINFAGQAPTPEDMTRLAETVRELAASCDWFVLSGSIPAGLPDTVYRDLVRDLRGARGKHVVLDTSGQGLRRGIEAAPDIIKPNLAELEELAGQRLSSEADILRAANDLLRAGIARVIVSLGRRGAYFIEGEQAILALPPPVEVASTVGAGDALVAGTVAGMLRGLDLIACARLATAFAAGAISRVGHQLPPPQVLERLADLVTTTRITR
jgi:1-phosphofructokinase